MSPPKNNALVIQNALIHGLCETDFNLQKCISLCEIGINVSICTPNPSPSPILTPTCHLLSII